MIVLMSAASLSISTPARPNARVHLHSHSKAPSRQGAIASADLMCGCREYADFRVSSDGEVQGVGLLIAADPTSGRLVVLAPIQGGPADRAGIQPGDEVGNTRPWPLLYIFHCELNTAWHVMTAQTSGQSL